MSLYDDVKQALRHLVDFGQGSRANSAAQALLITFWAPELKVQLVEGGRAPERKSADAVGLDCYARIPRGNTGAVEDGYQQGSHRVLMPGQRMKVDLGFKCEVPEGFEATVRPRSGWAVSDGVVAVFGTIDPDYRGELGALLVNLGERMVVVRDGERVAQLVVSPVARPRVLEVAELSATERGESGYGSTGR